MAVAEDKSEAKPYTPVVCVASTKDGMTSELLTLAVRDELRANGITELTREAVLMARVKVLSRMSVRKEVAEIARKRESWELYQLAKQQAQDTQKEMSPEARWAYNEAIRKIVHEKNWRGGIVGSILA